MSEAIAGRRGFRLTPFRTGFAAGVLLPLAAVSVWWLRDQLGEWKPRPFNVQVLSNGADVSRHGGVKIVVSGERRAMIQTCNGPCDDLMFQTNSGGDDVFRVKVLDASGHCVACDNGQYVTSGSGSWITRWTVSGAEALTSKITSVDRASDESSIEASRRFDTVPMTQR